MKNFKQLYIPIIAILGILQATAQPTPPNGKSWEKVEILSDEFNNNTLDRTKWQPTHPTWSGRSPSKYNSDNVSISGGNLRLKSTVKNDQKQGDWVWASCVSSNTKAMKKGYYSEARIKCSKLSMTTAFWFQGSDHIEIDVIENFGAPSSPNHANQNKFMKTNTHYFPGNNAPARSTPWDKKDLSVGVDETYYTYGVWWKDNKTVIFYLNGEEVHTSIPRGDFDEDQRMFFDTEVFSWGIGHPTLESLRDDTKNVGFIDWVHTYKLIDGSNNNDNTDGGNVSTINGSTAVTTITGDGIADLIKFKTTSNSSASYTYVITDEAGKILTTEQTSHDFEGASVGICKVYGLSYKGTLQLTGKNINASNLSSDKFSVSSNAIIVTRKEDSTGGGCDNVKVATLSEDAYLQGTTRFNSGELRIESGKRTSYLKFTVPAATGTITSAKLDLTVSTDSGNGLIEIFKGSSNNWAEANLSNSNKPTEGAKLGSLNTTYNKGQSYQWDLSGVTPGETISLIIKQTGGNDVSFSSKEGSKAPKLTLELDCNARFTLSAKNINAKHVDVKVFPNPTKDLVTITGINTGDHINVYNILGMAVKTKISKQKEEIVDMSGLASGLYIIKIPGKGNFQLVKK